MTILENSPTSTIIMNQGIAGRTNYAQWDKIATSLVQQVEEEAKLEEQEEKAKLGLDGKYAVSADDAAERAKAEELKKTKAKLDAIQQRENAVILELDHISVPFQLTREQVPNHKRVVRLSHTNGPGQVIFSPDLSKLERIVDMTGTATTTTTAGVVTSMINPLAKSFPDDAENDVNEDQTNTHRSVYGLIKLMVEHCQNLEIIVSCKLISGTIELHQCDNVKIVVQDPSVTTLQVDLCNSCSIQFQMESWNAKHNRILHAGCKQLHMSIVKNTNDTTDASSYNNTIEVVSEITADYLVDGAIAVGNAKPTEYQFITSMPNGTLITEAVAKSGVKAMTQRELEEAQRHRNKALVRATEMAESMVQIKDKDGNPLVAKTTTTTTTTTSTTSSTLLQSVEEIISECESFKIQGNEAFGAGEYAQALLHYSLSIDKAAVLDETSSQFPLDVVYANRAAACLKLGQHERALTDATMALEINPNNLKALFRKGLALHAGGQYYTALPVLAAAHKKEPKNQQIAQALRFCEVRVEQDQRKRMKGD